MSYFDEYPYIGVGPLSDEAERQLRRLFDAFGADPFQQRNRFIFTLSEAATTELEIGRVIDARHRPGGLDLFIDCGKQFAKESLPVPPPIAPEWFENMFLRSSDQGLEALFHASRRILSCSKDDGNEAVSVATECSRLLSGLVANDIVDREVAITVLKLAYAPFAANGECVDTFVRTQFANLHESSARGDGKKRSRVDWLTDEIVRTIPGLGVSRDAQGGIVNWYRWLSAVGWVRITKGEMTESAARLLRDNQRVTSGIRATIADSLLLVSGNREVASHDVSEWDKGDLYLPFADSPLGVNVRTAQIAWVPRWALMARRLPCEPDDRWQDSYWHECLKAWFHNQQDIRTFLMLMGNALAGNPAQKFVFLQGPGGTGKSSLIYAVRSAFGDFGAGMDVDYLVKQRGAFKSHPTGLLAIENKRIVTAGEIEHDNVVWNEGRLKDISGGDEVQMRGMAQDYRSHQSRALLMVYGNARPALRDVGNSMRRRLVMLCLDKRFDEDDPATDDFATTRSKLDDCLPHVLGSLVWGLQEFRKAGNRVVLSARIETHSREYIDDEDSLSELMERITMKAPGRSLTFAELRCRLKKEPEYANLSAKMLSKMLKEREYKMRRGTRGVKLIVGIDRAVDEQDRDWCELPSDHF